VWCSRAAGRCDSRSRGRICSLEKSCSCAPVGSAKLQRSALSIIHHIASPMATRALWYDERRNSPSCAARGTWVRVSVSSSPRSRVTTTSADWIIQLDGSGGRVCTIEVENVVHVALQDN